MTQKNTRSLYVIDYVENILSKAFNNVASYFLARDTSDQLTQWIIKSLLFANVKYNWDDCNCVILCLLLETSTNIVSTINIPSICSSKYVFADFKVLAFDLENNQNVHLDLVESCYIMLHLLSSLFCTLYYALGPAPPI